MINRNVMQENVIVNTNKNCLDEDRKTIIKLYICGSSLKDNPSIN